MKNADTIRLLTLGLFAGLMTAPAAVARGMDPFARPEPEWSHFSGTALQDYAWKLRSPADEWGEKRAAAMPFNVTFHFDQVDRFAPYTWEVEDRLGRFDSRNGFFSGWVNPSVFDYTGPGKFEGTFERRHGDWRDVYEYGITSWTTKSQRLDFEFRLRSPIGRAIARAEREARESHAATAAPASQGHGEGKPCRALLTRPVLSASAMTGAPWDLRAAENEWETTVSSGGPFGFAPVLLYSPGGLEAVTAMDGRQHLGFSGFSHHVYSSTTFQ